MELLIVMALKLLREKYTAEDLSIHLMTLAVIADLVSFGISCPFLFLSFAGCVLA